MDSATPTRGHACWFDPEQTSGDAAAPLRSIGWRVTRVRDLDEAAACSKHCDAIIIGMPDGTSLLASLVQRLRASNASPSLICRVPAGALDLAAEAARLGASHVVADDDRSIETWRRMLGTVLPAVEPLAAASRNRLMSAVRAPGDRSRGAAAVRSAVFVDPLSQHLLALALRVAQAEVTTLVVGPTGSGKEILARVLHEASPRACGPFVAFNCAALPDHLAEDLLFGHERGAFTGAHREHCGLFEQAHGGTLFLDEIGDMPLHLQSKLLRALQERQITRLGGTRPIDLDVRVIAATAQDLRRAISERVFREDLFYRIATFQLKIAPLADRPADILPLATQCLSRIPGPQGEPWAIDADARRRLLEHAWPGNVRELENVMRRATVLAVDSRIGAEHLMFDDADLGLVLRGPSSRAVSPHAPAAPHCADGVSHLHPGPPSEGEADGALQVCGAAGDADPANLQSAVRNRELHLIRSAIQSSGSRDEAARRLGISPRTLRYKIARLRERGLVAG